MCVLCYGDAAHDRACAGRGRDWAVPQPRMERHGGPVEPEPEPPRVSMPTPVGGKLTAEQRAVIADQVAQQRAAGRMWRDIAADYGRTAAWALGIAKLAKG